MFWKTATIVAIILCGITKSVAGNESAYVRICSVHGDGFYYLPGTDTCLKLGGYVRVEANVNSLPGHMPFIQTPPSRPFRSDYTHEIRGLASLDVRSQTEFGTLRAYISAAFSLTDQERHAEAAIPFFERAFVQFAGLTFGKATSYFAFYNNALNWTTLHGGGYSDEGLPLVAYTARLGHETVASISIEDGSFHNAGMLWSGSQHKQRIPDIVGSLRWEGARGAAQISGALHQVNPAGPETRMGFAVSAGLKLNLISPQSQLWLQATHSNGATQYIGMNPYAHTQNGFSMSSGTFWVDRSQAIALPIDGAITPGAGQIAFTKGWSVLAALEHYWTPMLRTSVFGHFTHLDFGAPDEHGTVAQAYCNFVFFYPGLPSNCDPSFSVWQIGARNVWSPVRGLDLGFEVLYTKLDQRHSGYWSYYGTARDQDTVSGTVRLQRNLYP